MTHSCSQAPLLTVRAPWWIALPKLLIKGGQSSDVCLAAEGMRNYKRWLFLSKYPSMSMNLYLTNSCLMELERNYVINYLEFNKYKKTKTKSSWVESHSIMYHVLNTSFKLDTTSILQQLLLEFHTHITAHEMPSSGCWSSVLKRADI